MQTKPITTIMQSASDKFLVSSIKFEAGLYGAEAMYESYVFPIQEDGEAEWFEVAGRRTTDLRAAQCNHINLCKEYEVNPEAKWKG